MNLINILVLMVGLSVSEYGISQTACGIGSTNVAGDLSLQLMNNPAISGFGKLTATFVGSKERLTLVARCFDVSLKEGLDELFDVDEKGGAITNFIAKDTPNGSESPPLLPAFHSSQETKSIVVSWLAQSVRRNDGQTLTCLRAGVAPDAVSWWMGIDGDCFLSMAKAKKSRPYFERAVHALAPK